MAALLDREDVWSAVVGQPAAVAALASAAERPVHAYLFVGPPGRGTLAAARAFSAAVLSADLQGADADRAVELALADQHPDVETFEPEGASMRVEEAEDVIRAAARSPVEGHRKVLVLAEFHKVTDVAAKLLKTIEEPSESTVFVILADEVPEELITVASRAVRIDFGPVPAALIEQHLLDRDVEPDRAADAAGAAGGDVERARLLASDDRLALRRDAWRAVPDRLDGSGSAALLLARELLAHIDDAQAPLDAAQTAEMALLVEQIDTYGQRRTPIKRLERQHKRAVRRHRTNEMIFGLATLGNEYRDLLATVDDVEPIVAALDLIQAAAEALIRNPNESLLLQALLVRLPSR